MKDRRVISLIFYDLQWYREGNNFPSAYEFSFSDGDTTQQLRYFADTISTSRCYYVLIYPMEKHDKSSSICYENNITISFKTLNGRQLQV
jgi:hypothetical protein